MLDHLPGMRRHELRDIAGVGRRVATSAADPTTCAVGDFSAVWREEKVALLRGALSRLARLRARRGVPHGVRARRGRRG